MLVELTYWPYNSHTLEHAEFKIQQVY
jgi:hypothetical protein